jgi:DNA-binding beta-propeller fold protein YncE
MANEFSEDYFKVVNQDNENTLYRTDDMGANELRFSFVNVSPSDITFNGGDSPSTLLFSMPFLRSSTVDPVKDFKITTPDGWEAVILLDKKWAVWKLVCKKTLVVPKGGSLIFTIKNILCLKYDPGYFYISTLGIPDYENVTPPIGKEFMVKEPAKKRLPLPMAVSFTDEIHPIKQQTGFPCTQGLSPFEYESTPVTGAISIYLTYDSFSEIKNGFKIILTPDEKIVITEQQVPRKAAIRIMFLFGTYAYQVTTTEKGNDIEIDPNQVGWKVKHTDDDPFWECSPDAQTLEAFIPITFDVGRLVTNMVALEGISLMYVQVNNFGDFADEVFKIHLIKKVAKPSIVSFVKAKNQINFGENVGISWNSALANKVEIGYTVRNNTRVVLSTAPKQGEYQIELTQCAFFPLPVLPTELVTSFEAIAYGPNNTKDSRIITVGVTQKVADIRNFKATPALIVQGVKTMVTLSWEVNDASQLRIFKGDVELCTLSNTSTSKQIEVDGKSIYKLVARAYDTQLPDTIKALTVYSFENKSTIPLPFVGDKKGDLPKALRYNYLTEKLLLAHCGKDELYIIAIASNQITKTLKTKSYSFELHPQKNALAYYYSEAKNKYGVYIHDFANPSKTGTCNRVLMAADYPMQLRFSPDGKKLYVAYVYSGGYLSIAYFHSEDLSHLAYEFVYHPLMGGRSTFIGASEDSSTVYFIPYEFQNRICVTNYKSAAPLNYKMRYLGLTHASVFLEPKVGSTEKKAYLAFENQNIIAVLNKDSVSDNESHVQFKTIDVSGQPFSMILSADEKTLYVACIKENKVVKVNTLTATVEHVYADIDTPSCLALSENNEFLFVGHHRSRTISAICLNTGSLSPSFSTGELTGNPMAISVFEDANNYTLYVTKESYSERTKWAATDVIKANTSLNISVITITKLTSNIS